MEHPHAKLAKLSRHHILALRLYTTSSFCKINDPLRKDPPRTDMGAAAGRHRHFCDRGEACAKQLSAPTPVNCTTVQNAAPPPSTTGGWTRRRCAGAGCRACRRRKPAAPVTWGLLQFGNRNMLFNLCYRQQR